VRPPMRCRLLKWLSQNAANILYFPRAISVMLMAWEDHDESYSISF
jgi:hypothetical protein